MPWLATTIPALATLLQVPVGLLVKSFGNRAVAVMMVLGQLAFVAMGAICAFVPRDQLASWGYALIVIFVLQGIGRSTYEGANRATCVCICIFFDGRTYGRADGVVAP